MMKTELEICAGDLASIEAAMQGGADRVEICCALPIGGLTPPASLLLLSERFSPRLRRHVLLRPRPGDFLYDEGEMECMKADISSPFFARIDGAVIGVLRADGSVDSERNAILMEHARKQGIKSFTFHRAFDMTSDPEHALEEIITLGFDRILTSGCAPSAPEGVGMLRRLNDQAAGKITIMAGGGVNASNVRMIAECAGIRSFHASCSRRIASRMRFRNEATSMGSSATDEYSITQTGQDLVRELADAVRSL